MKIEDFKPKYYLEIKNENKEGYYYPQPIYYVNGIKWEDFIKNNPSFNIGILHSESKKYTKALEILNSNSSQWKNNKNKTKAFKTIYENIDKCIGEIRELSLFEIELINNDFEITKFGAFNVYDFGRDYAKRNHVISLFIIRKNDSNLNVFITSKDNYNKMYQINNDLSLFKEAINGELTAITQQFKPLN